MSNKKIQILLSTYNGERFLREQLDSYLNLDNYGDVKVLIRDDGSTDSTLDILSEYERKYGFEVIRGQNIGLNASMYSLIAARDKECEYFSFSDQDDVWLKDKISRAVTALEDADATKPTLYASCSNLTDENLKITGHTLIPKKKLSFYNAMVQNVCPGHSEVCNSLLMDILDRSFSEKIIIFDYWVYLIASAFGNVIFDSTPTTLYRQHGSNAIGCDHSKIRVLKTRIKRVKTRQSVKNAIQLKSLYDIHKDRIPEQYKNEIESFFSSQKGLFPRLKYLSRSKVYRQTAIETLIFRFMYLFGRYDIDEKQTARQ